MKRRKLYYFPGLISIIGLPILLYFFGPDDFVQPTVLKFRIPSDKKDTPGLIAYTKSNFYKTIKNKKIISVELEDSSDDPRPNASDHFYSKMNFISREIERLQFTHDTSAILRVEFGDGCTYGQFVELINKAVVYRINAYAFVDNSLYFFTNAPPVYYVMEDLPAYDLSVYPPPGDYHEPTKWEIFLRHLKYQWEEELLILKYNKIYVIGFILLILIPGVRVNARRRRQSSILASSASLS